MNNKQTETKELYHWVNLGTEKRFPDVAMSVNLDIGGRPGFGKFYKGKDDKMELGFESTNGFGTLYDYQFDDVSWLEKSAPLPSSTQQVADTISIDALLSEFKRYGIDATNFDGDEGAEAAIALGVKNLLAEQSWEPAQEVKTAWKILDKNYYSFIGTRYSCDHWENPITEDLKECILLCMQEFALQQRSPGVEPMTEAWVRIEEDYPSTLPDIDKWVLGLDCTTHFADIAYHVCFRNENGWQKGGSMLNITHWQPLPAPPNSSTNDYGNP